jgi:stringent starvation protein B
MYEWVLDNDCTPYLDVNATHKDLVIPREFVTDNSITFNLSADAIKDLRMGNDAIEFTAKFSGQIMHIFIPIDAVVSIYAQENRVGMMFDTIGMGTEKPNQEKPEPSPLRVVKKSTK